MAEPDSGFAEIRALAAELHALHRHMAAAYAPIVQDILQRRSRDVQEIEHTLDHLLDCACIPEGLALFKSLCRYYYGINPAATADYVYAYRDMWDSEAEPEQKEKTPAPICRKELKETVRSGIIQHFEAATKLLECLRARND